MRAVVLGSAAGGGFPQWNCRCPVCCLAWEGDPRVERRTQSSLAITSDNQNWVLFNCSPDIREQIERFSPLKPQHSPRHSPIAAVVLTSADADHIVGLLSLREGHAFTVWADAATLKELRANPLFAVLNEEHVAFQLIPDHGSFVPAAGLPITAFRVSGKPPLYREQELGIIAERSGTTLGLHVDCGDRRLSYVPGCAAIDDEVRRELAETDVLLFDGTLWQDDEMVTSGTSSKSGARMGHVAMLGEQGSLARLAALFFEQRYFIHINNTNPVLISGSPQRVAVEQAGWRIPSDGEQVFP